MHKNDIFSFFFHIENIRICQFFNFISFIYDIVPLFFLHNSRKKRIISLRKFFLQTLFGDITIGVYLICFYCIIHKICNKYNTRIRIKSANFPRCLYSVFSRHPDIQNIHIEFFFIQSQQKPFHILVYRYRAIYVFLCKILFCDILFFFQIHFVIIQNHYSYHSNYSSMNV